jgi:hypothetical protein
MRGWYNANPGTPENRASIEAYATIAYEIVERGRAYLTSSLFHGQRHDTRRNQPRIPEPQ